MIQSLLVRAIASPLAGVVVFLAAELTARAAAPASTVAVYWQPPEVAALGGAARAATRAGVSATAVGSAELGAAAAEGAMAEALEDGAQS